VTGEGVYTDQLVLDESYQELHDALQLMFDSDAWKYVEQVLTAFNLEAIQALTNRNTDLELIRWYQGRLAVLEDVQRFLKDQVDFKEEVNEDEHV
jgi:hypothetical protein